MPKVVLSLSSIMPYLLGAYPPCPSSAVPERHKHETFERLNRTHTDSVNTTKRTACSVAIIHGTGGWYFAQDEHAMTPSLPIRAPRRKAVWGPRRTLTAFAVLVLGLATTNVFAQGPHARRGARVGAGRPNYQARIHRQLDSELTFRADHGLALAKTTVIVTLKQGAQLPAEFSQYSNNRRLGI